MSVSGTTTFVARLVVFLCFNPLLIFSSGDSTAKWLRLSLNAGFIINNTFSHIDKQPSHQRYGSPYSSVKGASDNKTGFNIGETLILGRSRSLNAIVGLSISESQAEYLYSDFGGQQEGGPPHRVVHTASFHIVSKINYLNLEAGFKFRLRGNLFLQPSFLLHTLNKTTEKRTGTIKISEYYNATRLSETSRLINETFRYSDENRGSFRLTLSYRIKIKKLETGIYVFRNFGIGYLLPWYSAGISVNIL